MDSPATETAVKSVGSIRGVGVVGGGGGGVAAVVRGTIVGGPRRMGMQKRKGGFLGL